MTEPTLTSRLRAETKEAHTKAERSGIMRALLQGKISRKQYVNLLENLAAIYIALETEIDRHNEQPGIRDIAWGPLKRGRALANDIAVLQESAPGMHAPILAPSTVQYVKRLHDIAATEPQLLLAHAYLRYLGDMYGGQIIKRIVLEKVLPDLDNAVSFYDFSALSDMHEFMVTFRNVIDAVVSSVTADQMVAEAQLGYELHAEIFTELAAENADGTKISS